MDIRLWFYISESYKEQDAELRLADAACFVFRDAAAYSDVAIATLWSVRQWRSPWVGRDISGAEWRNAQMSTECTQRVHLYNAPVPNTTSVCIHL
jgi:hypothetical protein